MSLLEMKHIKKSFDGIEVLKDISLKVDEGEVLGHYRSLRFRQIHSSSVRDESGDAGFGRNPL